MYRHFQTKSLTITNSNDLGNDEKLIVRLYIIIHHCSKLYKVIGIRNIPTLVYCCLEVNYYICTSITIYLYIILRI